MSPSEIVRCSSFVQLSKADSPISVTAGGIATEASRVQPLNAQYSIVFTLDGMITLVRFGQSRNAFLEIEVTPSSITIDLMLLLSLKPDAALLNRFNSIAPLPLTVNVPSRSSIHVTFFSLPAAPQIPLAKIGDSVVVSTGIVVVTGGSVVSSVTSTTGGLVHIFLSIGYNWTPATTIPATTETISAQIKTTFQLTGLLSQCLMIFWHSFCSFEASLYVAIFSKIAAAR